MLKRTKILFVVTMISGCGLLPEHSFTPSPCGDEIADISGTWMLSSDGSRSECQDDDFNTDSFSTLPIDWSFEQTESTDGATSTFEQNGGVGFEREDFEITKGKINGSCISFDVSEPGVILKFTGNLVNFNSIEGEFTSAGPETCKSKGTFSLSRK